MSKPNLNPSALAQFGRRWKVRRLDVFGSAVRGDFGPESDIDMLVDFELDARPTLFDLAAMEEELETIYRRRVDLRTRNAVERSPNTARRASILHDAQPVYQAA